MALIETSNRLIVLCKKKFRVLSDKLKSLSAIHYKDQIEGLEEKDNFAGIIKRHSGSSEVIFMFGCHLCVCSFDENNLQISCKNRFKAKETLRNCIEFTHNKVLVAGDFCGYFVLDLTSGEE